MLRDNDGGDDDDDNNNNNSNNSTKSSAVLLMLCISGSPLPLYGAFSVCGYRKWTLAMGKAVNASRNPPTWGGPPLWGLRRAPADHKKQNVMKGYIRPRTGILGKDILKKET